MRNSTGNNSPYLQSFSLDYIIDIIIVLCSRKIDENQNLRKTTIFI